MQSDIAIFGEWAHAATIMLMIQNNLDPGVAHYPQELITMMEWCVISKLGSISVNHEVFS